MKLGFCLASVVAVLLCQARSGRADEAPVEPQAAPAAAPAPEASDKDKTAAKASFREPGRFGLVGSLTSDGFQFGATRIGEHYEIVLTADSSFVDLKNSTGLAGATGDIGTTIRGGPRFALGQLNYFVAGISSYVALFGKDNGVSTMGTFSIGPYVGIERHFAGTPLLISLWVLPYKIERDVSNDGSGGRQVAINHQFFQGGGFGLSYLF